MWSHRGKDAPILPGDKVRIDPQLSRRVLLAVSTLLLFGTVLTVLIIVLIWSSSKHDDRLAVISNWLGAGTLALAVFAGLVALRAYAVATGPPDLKFKVQFADLPPNVLTIARESRDLHGSVAGEISQTSISLHNTSKYSARNPAVIVRLHNAGIRQEHYAVDGRWTQIDWTDIGGGIKNFTAIQWDGGPMRSIHGGMKRRLPMLNLQGLHRVGEMPTLTVELLAEGYIRRKAIRLIFATGPPGEQLSESSKLPPEWL